MKNKNDDLEFVPLIVFGCGFMLILLLFAYLKNEQIKTYSDTPTGEEFLVSANHSLADSDNSFVKILERKSGMIKISYESGSKKGEVWWNEKDFWKEYSIKR